MSSASWRPRSAITRGGSVTSFSYAPQDGRRARFLRTSASGCPTTPGPSSTSRLRSSARLWSYDCKSGFPMTARSTDDQHTCSRYQSWRSPLRTSRSTWSDWTTTATPARPARGKPTRTVVFPDLGRVTPGTYRLRFATGAYFAGTASARRCIPKSRLFFTSDRPTSDIICRS